MCVFSFLQFVVFSLISLSIRAHSDPSTISAKQAAAECVAEVQHCPKALADKSGVCKESLYFYQQPRECATVACEFCYQEWAKGYNFCVRSWTIKNRCPEIMAWFTVTPTASSSPSAMTTTSMTVTMSASASFTPSLTASWAPTAGPEFSASASPSSSVSQTPSFSAAVSPRPSVSGPIPPSETVVASARPSSSAVDNASANNEDRVDDEIDTQSSDSSMSAPGSEGTKSATECTWFADEDQLVIPMSRVIPKSYWSRYSSRGHVGIQWRAGDSRQQVDPAGVGELCFRVAFTMPGTYYLTAISAAPHGTEHNDMWIHFNGGLDLFDAGTNQQMNGPWATPQRTYKAYQNIGGNRIADIISTVNHNPHIFVTQPVTTGTAYRLCIDGRSSQFKVFELVMLRCSGNSCKRNSNHIRNTMADILLKEQVSDSVC